MELPYQPADPEADVTVTFHINAQHADDELSQQDAMALAELSKRLHCSEILGCATDNKEAYVIGAAARKLHEAVIHRTDALGKTHPVCVCIVARPTYMLTSYGEGHLLERFATYNIYNNSFLNS